MSLAMTNAQILAHKPSIAVGIVASKNILGGVCKDERLYQAVRFECDLRLS